MPPEPQLSHRNVKNANLPYISNLSPTATDPCYIPGSQNILTSIDGTSGRRPGFSEYVETTATTFNNLQRTFTWDRNDGTFYVMFCDISASNQAQVYKMQVGVDVSAVSIYTDTGSSSPFDFVVSNNTLYFSNGHIAKKWDPVNGVSNWGISIGSVNNATGPNGCGTGADGTFTGGKVWSNPGNITANDGAFATVTCPAPSSSIGPNSPGTASGTSWTSPLNVRVRDGAYAQHIINPGVTCPALAVTGYGFAVPPTATIVGISATVYRNNLTGSGSMRDGAVQLLKNGVAVGSNKAAGTGYATTQTQSYGGATDLWGTSWTPADINKTNFGISISVHNLDASIQTAGIDYVSITVYYLQPGQMTFSDYLKGTNFGFALANTARVQGILVEVKGLQTQVAGSFLAAQLLKAGNLVGTAKSGTQLPSSNNFVSFGSNSDLWGTTWTPNDVNQTTFGISLQAFNGSGAAVSFSVDFVRITLYGLGGPSITVSGSAGTMTATVGYQYVFCYGNSNTAHVSSPTPASASTGVFSNKLKVSVDLTASTDPQVNQIRVFRSTDSVAAGTTAAAYFELPNSPFPNTTATIDDDAADTSLIVANVAPTATFNDPPPPGLNPVYFAGRIWMIVGNKVWFSGLEETLLGVPEESWPSGIAGNFWAFDQPVNALAVAGSGNNQTLLCMCGGRVYGISGFTLDTFQRTLVSARRGCRSLTATSSLGGMVAWLDSANQVWATDGSSLQEIATEIRPDLVDVVPANCSLTFHAAGRYHWLILSTGSLLYVYDMDLQRWMPPWTFSCRHLHSGEVSPGSYRLMASTPSYALQLGSAHNDHGAPYQPIWQTNLFSMVPDFGGRFSYTAAGVYDEPSRTGMPWYFQVDTNANDLQDVQFIMDDDPLNPPDRAYISIMRDKTTIENAFNRFGGTNLVQNVWAMRQPYSRFIGWKFLGRNFDDSLKVYGFFTAYQTKK